MELILMRHALAEERSARWPDDTQRPLSKEGEKKHRAVSEALLSFGLRFDEIVSSPLIRARQTADITARVFGWNGTNDCVMPKREQPGAWTSWYIVRLCVG